MPHHNKQEKKTHSVDNKLERTWPEDSNNALSFFSSQELDHLPGLRLRPNFVPPALEFRLCFDFLLLTCLGRKPLRLLLGFASGSIIATEPHFLIHQGQAASSQRGSHGVCEGVVCEVCAKKPGAKEDKGQDWRCISKKALASWL